MVRFCIDGTWSDDQPECVPVRSSGPNTKCVLPPYPKHGSYEVVGAPNAKPGEAFDYVAYNITCNRGYTINEKARRSRFCFDGTWSSEQPECVRFCSLDKDPSITYRCTVGGDYSSTRICNDMEPSGSVVIPECNAPNYYSPNVLNHMRCIDGSWDYVARCSLECGLVTSVHDLVISGGGPDSRDGRWGELPWHVGIYKKTTGPYMQICGGSLVSTRIVISAAHCFWNDVTKQQPASNYAVAVGKMYRAWDDKRDQEENVQRSDVKEIHLPVRFQGGAANFQDDIAVLQLVEVIVFRPTVRPVCIDFDVVFEGLQLQEGLRGKVGGWGLTSANGAKAELLQAIEMPYILIQECFAEAPPDFRQYITGDKICAGFRNGTALCMGDSGGGLSFPVLDKGRYRYFLRGIASAAATDDHLCNLNWLNTFTLVSRHEHFIKSHLLL